MCFLSWEFPSMGAPAETLPRGEFHCPQQHLLSSWTSWSFQAQSSSTNRASGTMLVGQRRQQCRIPQALLRTICVGERNTISQKTTNNFLSYPCERYTTLSNQERLVKKVFSGKHPEKDNTKSREYIYSMTIKSCWLSRCWIYMESNMGAMLPTNVLLPKSENYLSYQ